MRRGLVVSGYAPILEAVAVLAVTFPLAVGFHLPTLWFLAPLIFLAFTQRSYAEYGLGFDHLGGPLFHIVVVVAVFVPYVIGHILYAHWWIGATFHFRLPEGLLWLILDQVFVVALPEEVFFRGYFQRQCDRVWGTPYRFAGASWGWGLPCAAAVFAVCHILHGGPARLIVFFPGLFYGWLRARTGTVAVPTLYHAASNVLMSIMLTSLSV